MLEQFGHEQSERAELKAQHEQNMQSFAEPPPEEPESELMQEIDPEMEELGSGQMLADGQLLGIESPVRGSFNQGSMIDDSRI